MSPLPLLRQHKRISLALLGLMLASLSASTAYAQAPLIVDFKGLTATAPDSVDPSGKYEGDAPAEFVEGRLPGSNAARLDKSCHAFPAPDIDAGQGFTTEMWVRRFGQGVVQGGNGMLFAIGDGYWSGIRCYIDASTGRAVFQIGRPQPSNAISAASKDGAPDGAWNHIACTWDGRVMRVYLNGLLTGEQEYEGVYTAPSNPKLRLGYANAGVGSNRMDVDSFAMLPGVLSPEDLLRRALDRPTLSDATVNALMKASEALREGRAEEAAALLQAMTLTPVGTPEGALSRLLAADAALALGQHGQASTLLRDVYANAGGDRWKAMAVARFLPNTPSGRRTPGAVAANAPLALYETLYASREGDARFAAGLALAKAYVGADRYDEAIALYDEMLADEALPEPTRIDLQSQRVEALFCRERAAGKDTKEILADTRNERAALLEAPAFQYMQRLETEVADTKLADPLAQWRPFQKADTSSDGMVFVAPTGNDADAGTADAPLATLQAARDAARRLRKDGKPATVFLRGGVYTIDAPLELTAEDSGDAEHPTIFRAYPGETPVLTGGVELTSFQPVDDPAVLKRLPEEARGHVLCCDLKAAGVTDFGSLQVRGMGGSSPPVRPWVDLVVDDRAMTIARWPNEAKDELLVGAVHRGAMDSPEQNGPAEFEFSHERMDRWASASDIWLEGKWGHLWAAKTIPVEKIDRATGRIHTGAGSGYGLRPGMPFHFLNLLEEIDRPGEWMLDRATGMLYVWPPTDAPSPLTAKLSIFDGPFVRIDGASSILIDGITFEMLRGDAMFLKNCTDVLVAGCTMRHLGGNAIVVNGGDRCGAAGCDIYSVGAGGVRLHGGDRATLERADHFVVNCEIADFSRIDRSYAPAVLIDGVGHHVLRCRMFDSPHHAIRLEGDLHTIALCETSKVVYEYDDQAGIDVWGDPTYRGNRFLWNHWRDIANTHDVAGQAGIRLDDMISGVLIYGNIFERSAGGHFGGVQIHGGKDNIVRNNLFVDCQAAVSFSQWPDSRYFETLERSDVKHNIERGVNDLRLKRFPTLDSLEVEPNRNFIVGNVAVNCPVFLVRDRGVNIYLANDMFQGDLQELGVTKRCGLTPDSPILRRTMFQPIPVERIGLYEGDYRRSTTTPRSDDR